jgi:hypothetical protein
MFFFCFEVRKLICLFILPEKLQNPQSARQQNVIIDAFANGFS